MIVSSVFALKESNDIPSNLLTIQETKLEPGYYFNSTLDFLSENQKEILESNQNFYKTILEADENNPYIIEEGFMEVISILKNVIKKILAYIETMVKKFVTQIAKFVNSDKYILSMEKQISKFGANDKIEISGYNYTFDNNIPVIDIDELNVLDIKRDLDVIASSNDITDKISKMTELNSRLSENNMDNVRAKILKSDHDITETSYENELVCKFRDGSSTPENITIGRSGVMRALSDYKGYKDKIKIVQNNKSQIEAKYKELINMVDSIKVSNITTSGDVKDTTLNNNENLKQALNNIINQQVNMIQRIANLHTLALMAKIDALSESTVQDKNILYKALSKVQSNPANNVLFKESDEKYYADYTAGLKYKQFLYDKYYMNMEQKHFVNECIALSESNISELKSINEDLTMDKKEKFEKFRKIMKNIINKFTEKMGSFANRDKKYLEEHKDTILTKTVEKPYTINNMPTYSLGIKNINSWQQPNYNIKDLVSLSKEDIQKKVINTYDGNGEFSEFAKRYFLCNNTDNKDILSTNDEVDMKKLYEYCINMPNDVKRINTDSAKFESSIKAAVAATLNASTNESVNVLGRKYIYSSVLEMYINEEDVNDTKSAGGENQKETEIKPAENQTSKQQTAKTDNKVPEEDKEKKETDKNDNNQETKEKQSTENKKAEETASWYIQSVQVAIAAKITAMQKIYSEYMKIIRYHVGVIEGKSEDKPEDDGKLKSLLKEFKNAKSSDDRKAASNKIIDYFKTSKGKTIDAHEVQSMADNVKDN